MGFLSFPVACYSAQSCPPGRDAPTSRTTTTISSRSRLVWSFICARPLVELFPRARSSGAALSKTTLSSADTYVKKGFGRWFQRRAMRKNIFAPCDRKPDSHAGASLDRPCTRTSSSTTQWEIPFTDCGPRATDVPLPPLQRIAAPALSPLQSGDYGIRPIGSCRAIPASKEAERSDAVIVLLMIGVLACLVFLCVSPVIGHFASHRPGNAKPSKTRSIQKPTLSAR